jgi:hypothetical protein
LLGCGGPRALAISHPLQADQAGTPYAGFAGPGISRLTYQLPVQLSPSLAGRTTAQNKGWGREPEPYLEFYFYVECVTGG